MSVLDRAREVLGYYPLGKVLEITPVDQGLVHATFFVDTSAGRFVLQRLAPAMASDAILADHVAVTAHLARKGMPSPEVVLTVDEGTFAIDPDRRRWRLQTRLPGTTRPHVPDADAVEEAARALGRFHVAMQDFGPSFQSSHPGHDTALHLERLKKAAADPANAEHLAPIAEEVAMLTRVLPDLLPPGDLPRRVVHGDPKFSNVLFEDGRALALIDLDTCARTTVLADLGDAARSWCRTGGEDEPTEFLPARFEALLRGYDAEGLRLEPRERALLPAAVRWITLELAARFAWDALVDEYFGWDADRYPSRRAHDAARMRAAIALAESVPATL